jgi:hypothetical protein
LNPWNEVSVKQDELMCNYYAIANRKRGLHWAQLNLPAQSAAEN